MGVRRGDPDLVGTERSGGVTPPDPGPSLARADPPVIQRHRAQVLRRIVAACAGGHLDHAELADLSEAAQQAKTVSGLNAVVADVPGPGQAAVAGYRVRARRFILGFLGPAGWRPFRALAERVAAAAVFGEVMIDLRRTAVTSFVTDITAVALAGEVRIVVPAGYRVDTRLSAAVFGRAVADIPAGRPGPLTPVIRLTSVAVLGNVLTSQVPPVT